MAFCRIIDPTKVDSDTLKVQRTPRGDRLFIGKLAGLDGFTTLAIDFSDNVAQDRAAHVCRSFSGELFDDKVNSFSVEEIEEEEISNEQFDTYLSVAMEEDENFEIELSSSLDIEPETSTYAVTVLRAGETLANHNGKPIVFSAEMLKQSVPLFDKAVVRAYRTGEFFDHLENLNIDLAKAFPKGLRDARIGTLQSVRYADDKEAIVADLLLLKEPQAVFLDKMLRKAQSMLGSLSNFMGLSVVVDILWRNGSPHQIVSCKGVDVVSIPAGGGHFDAVLQSVSECFSCRDAKEEIRMKDKYIKLILALNPDAKAEDLEQKTEEELLSVWRDLSKDVVPPLAVKREDDAEDMNDKLNEKEDPAAVGAEAAEAKFNALTDTFADKLDEKMGEFTRVYAKMDAQERVKKANLPQPSKDKLILAIDNLAEITDENVSALITGERTYLDTLQKDEGFVGMGVGIEVGDSSVDKLTKAFAAELGVPTEGEKVEPINLRKFYMEMTGDIHMQGPEYTAPARFAAVVADFPNTLANVLYKRLLSSYREAAYGEENLITDYRTAQDFKNMRTALVGGFGTFSTVTELQAYQESAIPDDWATDFAVAKYGGLLAISWETIVNDDVGLIRRLVSEYGIAMRRTHASYVYGLMTANPTMYDSLALFQLGTHANILTTAFGTGATATSRLETIRTAMYNKTKPGTTAKLGLKPYHLFIPIDLYAAAVGVNQQQYNTNTFTPNTAWKMFGDSNERIHVVPFFTSAVDWYVMGNTNDCPFIEMAYLNGKREPELLLQDQPTVGSVFTAEKITYKVRHIFGGVPIEWRNVHFQDV